MNEPLTDLDQAILSIITLPARIVAKLWRMLRNWRFYQIAYTAHISCRNCGATIWLVGLWRCSCGFTYKGHLMRVCPVCDSLPVVARCYRCGVTEKLPEL